MPNEFSSIHIDLTPEYKRNLRNLSKKYRNIRADTQEVIEQIQQGNFIGDRIANLGENYFVLKVRLKNSSIQKGKRAGYRLIYQVESPTSILLLTIYSKSDIEDISAYEIYNIIANFNENE